MSTQHAGRRTTTSPLRRATHLTLGAGAVLGLAAAFGPIWIVRAGIALAVIAGVLAVRFAWLELRANRLEHGDQVLGQALAHNEQLTTERQRNLEVVEALRQAGEGADEQVVKLQIRIGQLRTELSSLRGDHAALKADVIARDHRIKRLTADLAARENELREAKGVAEDAEVLSMPRYASKADWDALPTAEDLWSEGNHPTVVDLQKLAFPSEDHEEIRKQA
ncbi:MAG: hypothetical protein Q4F67_03975 [Propionibacteriaceae bacterium]|nr:hypothetical protein [Propionibacteriaceae bacterium]